jgi:hypothetical protein
MEFQPRRDFMGNRQGVDSFDVKWRLLFFVKKLLGTFDPRYDF